jgi:3-oxoacyl-[acyl-carrier protein] reductase
MTQRVAIVTGGSSGIGQGLSLALAAAGYCVVVVGKTAPRVKHTQTRLRPVAGGHLGLVLDVTRETDVATIVDRTMASYGRIDVLVASAGVGKTPGSTRLLPHASSELPLEEWRHVIDVNLTGAFLCTRAVVHVMAQQQSGHVVLIGSSTTPRGLRGRAYAPAYCASKFALMGLAEAVAAEVAAHGIRVQVILPGPVDTPLVSQTGLARLFGGSLSSEQFAQAAIYHITQQPPDAVSAHLHILPCAPHTQLAAQRTA